MTSLEQQNVRRRAQRTSLCGRSGGISRLLAGLVVLLVSSICFVPQAGAANLDEMSLERWKKLREVERYQLKIAERFYREKNWKVAASEYEKYLTLYERSDAASFVQLKWSLCQVHLRKLNTAVTDGFQSVVDYWPESDDAVAASFYIGRTYKNMGEVKKAKKAYAEVLSEHPDHLVSVYAMVDLIDLTEIDNDVDTRVELWKKLTFETKRTRESNGHCVNASRSLASYYFANLAFDDGVKALDTTYNDEQLPYYTLYYSRGHIQNFVRDSKTKTQGEKLADLAIAFIREQVPTDTSDEETEKRARQLWYYIADLYSYSARDQQVEETYEKIGKLYGIDDGLLGRLAEWHKSRNRYDEARATYRRFKDKVAGTAAVAYSYRQQGNYTQAIATYRQVLALDPENPVKWKPEIANNYRYGKKWKEAIAVYEELIKDDVEKPARWRWEIGECYRYAGDYKQAIAVYRQCENYFPTNYERMASCHRALKEWNEAILLYNQIVGGSPGRAPWALLQIGYTQEQAGAKEKAIKAFQSVCKRFPKDGHASQAHAHVQNKYKVTLTFGGGKDASAN